MRVYFYMYWEHEDIEDVVEVLRRKANRVVISTDGAEVIYVPNGVTIPEILAPHDITPRWNPRR